MSYLIIPTVDFPTGILTMGDFPEMSTSTAHLDAFKEGTIVNID
jgi:hypothetical protein